jgi:hypothetical protein
MDAQQRETTQRWLQALGSNNYDQTTGALRTENGFCCIGVLANVIDYTKWVNSEHFDSYTYGSNGPRSTLGLGEFMAWTGIDGYPEIVPKPSVEFFDFDWNYNDYFSLQVNLTDLNDSGATLFQIGTYIEAIIALNNTSEEKTKHSSDIEV